MLTTLGTDLRFAVRVLRKSPVFTIVAVLCISFGSGAVTTIFSAMNALVLGPMPGVRDADRLVRIERVRRDGEGGSLGGSYPYFAHLRDGARTLDGIAAYGKVYLTMTVGDEGMAAYGTLVSGNFFTVLGVRPALGRFFAPEEDRTELSHPVIVVSHGYWRSRLAADSSAIGRAIVVNGHPFTVIGVAPEEFRGLDTPIRTDAWVPAMMQRQLRQAAPALTNASASWLRLFGRLTDGATANAAASELASLTSAFASDVGEPERFAAFDSFRLSRMTALPPDARGPLSGFLALLLGAAALVLLIASVNVASMLSARAVARRREMAVRAALGAGRARLVRQLLTEILVLFVLGAFGGVLLAVLATSALEQLQIPGTAGAVTVSLELTPDLRVLAFALLLSLVTGLLFGLAPALQAARRDIATRLRAESAGGGTRRSVMTNTLIVGQLAFSLVLLVAAGLFARALNTGLGVDPGFDTDGVAVASFNSESWGYDEAKARAFFTALREQVEAIPGVTAVSYTVRLPLTHHSSGDEILIDGVETRASGSDAGGGVPISLANVDADYFTALRLPIVRGRAIGRSDDERAARVAVVNETLARRFWPDGSALGRTFGFRGQRVTIVGVARDARYATLTETTPPFVYFPLAQHWQTAQTLLVRTDGDAARLAPAIRRAARALDPALPRPTVTTLRQETGIVLLPQRVAAMVTGALGLVGLLLASVGLYGVIAYSASRRTREIGVRMALGARRVDVLGLIVRDGMWLAGLGVLIGLVLAAGVTRLIAGFLFDVSPFDAFTFAGMSVLFVVVALVASWLPARRAASADPVAALRAE